MKHYKLKFFLSLVMALCTMSASAYDFMVDSIAYNIINETEVAVTFENNSSPRYSQLNVAVIPATVTNAGITYTVTSIGANAFRESTTLSSISIPSTVTAVNDSAFYKCTALAEVHISSLESWCNVTFARYEDNPIYYARRLFLNDEEITDLVIPDGVTEIKDYAFYSCKSSTSVTIPDCVLTIGKSAFGYNSNITSLTIGESVTSIATGAFQGCSKLTTARIPDSVVDLGGGVFQTCQELRSAIIGNSVKKLGSLLFYACHKLKSVTIGNSVTEIVAGSFSACNGLLTLTIPGSVTKIESSAFDDCYALTSINVASDNPYYDSRDSCNAIIHTATNTLVKGCKNTVIPNTVEIIGRAAFKEVGMQSMPIPNSVKRIEHIAFWLCRSLRTVHIPSSVTYIDDSSFKGCNYVSSITVDSDNPVFDSRDSCNAIIITATDELLFGCNNTVIPKSVKIIGDAAFYENYTLETAEFGDSVTLIRLNAFYDCRNLSKVILGKQLKTIGGFAFYGCKKLETVTIPATVTSIGRYAFHYCHGLKSVICYAVTPPSMPDVETFTDYNTAVLYVPEVSVEAYQTTNYWSRFTTILPIKKGDANGDSVLSINDVTTLIEMLLSDDTSTVNMANADLNEDGYVNITDVTALINMLLEN